MTLLKIDPGGQVAPGDRGTVVPRDLLDDTGRDRQRIVGRREGLPIVEAFQKLAEDRGARHVWLIASEDFDVLGRGAAQVFLQAHGGAMAFGPDDVFLRRDAVGRCEALGDTSSIPDVDLSEAIAALVARSFACADVDPGPKGRVFDVLALTIAPKAEIAQANAVEPRNAMERRLLRLARHVAGEDAETTLSMIVDAVEGRAGHVDILGDADPPGPEETGGDGRTGFGVIVHRLCVFALASEMVARRREEGLRAFRLSPIGHVPIREDLLIETVRGLRSAYRRILASVVTEGDRVSVRAGVYDELQAFLRLEALGADHDDVEALVIDAETIVFDTKPWTLFPKGPVLFEGRLIANATHELTIRAALAACHDLRLHCVLASEAPASLFFV